ncbi:MAG: hypothetical protein DRO98_03390 [Archaeoglobales archaeon]|nr:MAG: hypothetical protein DRO98_03390 [Archaeoglobales archaeon]
MSEKNWRERDLKLAMINWKGEVYVGHIKEIAPEHSEEIIFLSKTFNPLSDELADTIRDLHPDIIDLHADDSLNLIGRYHVVRRLGSRLTHLTLEQEEYVGKRMLRVYELIMEDAILGRIGEYY